MELESTREHALSKFMCLILRHNPAKFGVVLENGWCHMEDLADAINEQHNWSGVTVDEIRKVSDSCTKQRYTIEGERIRANYGHSFSKLEYEASEPPEILYHGTNAKSILYIAEQGLKPMRRQYVHLSKGTEFATMAGKRRKDSAFVLVQVAAKRAHEDGVKFYHAGNDVWLCEHVPSKYLSEEDAKED